MIILIYKYLIYLIINIIKYQLFLLEEVDIKYKLSLSTDSIQSYITF